MRTYTAVLHTKNNEPLNVFQLGSRVSVNLAANLRIFALPDPALTVLDPEIDKLNTAIVSKDGSKQKYQAVLDQTKVVFGMLKSECIYVNKVAAGDKSIILLSGFDCNDDPVTHDIPAKALIKRVEDGSVACSAKIFMDAVFEADRYKVEISTTPADPDSWRTVLDFGVLNKLEIRNLVRAQEIFIRVSAGNSRGWGQPSEPVSFIPR